MAFAIHIENCLFAFIAFCGLSNHELFSGVVGFIYVNHLMSANPPVPLGYEFWYINCAFTFKYTRQICGQFAFRKMNQPSESIWRLVYRSQSFAPTWWKL